MSVGYMRGSFTANVFWIFDFLRAEENISLCTFTIEYSLIRSFSVFRVMNPQLILQVRHDTLRASDQTHAIKAGLQPVAAITDTGDNDTSVAERRSFRSTRGRFDSYGAVQQTAA